MMILIITVPALGKRKTQKKITVSWKKLVRKKQKLPGQKLGVREKTTAKKLPSG